MSLFLSLCCTGPIIQIMFIVIQIFSLLQTFLQQFIVIFECHHLLWIESQQPLWDSSSSVSIRPHTNTENLKERIIYFVKTLIMNVCVDGRHRHFPIDNWIYYWMTRSVKLKQIYRKFGSITTELSRLGIQDITRRHNRFYNYIKCSFSSLFTA